MAYPEKGASYRNKPAWMERVTASEKRAEGGPLIDSRGRTMENPDNEFMTNEPPARLVEAGSHHAAQDARDQAARRTRNSRAMPERHIVGGEPDRKSGGGVRRRATGGGIDAGSVEDRGPKKASPGPSAADWRDSKFKGDRDFYGTKVHSPVSEGSQREISGTIVNDMDHAKGGRVRRRADGGRTEMASSDMKPTDPTITAADIKTHGSADNARAAARAREYAEKNPIPESEKREMMNRMGRGIGQSIGFKRGGAPRRADGGVIPKTPVPMPTVEPKEKMAPIEGTPSESNKPSFLRGKKPL